MLKIYTASQIPLFIWKNLIAYKKLMLPTGLQFFKFFSISFYKKFNLQSQEKVV